MIDLKKYVSNDEDLQFLEELRTILGPSRIPITLKCGQYSFLIEPIGENEVQIWRHSKLLAEYHSVDDMFLNFSINGKTFIEQIEEIDYE